jgi:ABC-type lipoprotein export system ATPase subunit
LCARPLITDPDIVLAGEPTEDTERLFAEMRHAASSVAVAV